MRFTLLLLFFLVASATACVNGDTVVTGEESATNRDVPLTQEFTLKVGETVRVEGTHLLVMFQRVAEDSRCAADVQCVWAGDALVEVALSSDIAEFATQTRTLHTPQVPHGTDFLGVHLELLDVAPDPRTDTTIDPASYIARLVATRS